MTRYQVKDGKKRCPTCEKWLPLSAFHPHPRASHGAGPYCRPCKIERQRAWIAKRKGIITPENIRNFWARVKKDVPGPLLTPCWIWQGAPRKRDGYGEVVIAGKKQSPHQFTLMLAGREPTPELPFADHMCRVRLCCNPDHLRYVTPGQNALENNDSASALNKRKTYCKHGHPFSGANLQVFTNTYGKLVRRCMTCYRAAGARFCVKQKQQREAKRQVGF